MERGAYESATAAGSGPLGEGDGAATGSRGYEGRSLEEGMRVGRFLIVRDVDGNMFGVAASAASVVRATDEGTVMLLPGGRTLHVNTGMATVLAWLDGRSR